MSGASSLMGVPDGRFDGHAHIFLANLPMVKNRRYTPAQDAPFGDYAELLRAHGLQGGILVQTSFLGTDNSHLLETLELAGQCDDLTFRGVIVVDPDISMDELQQHKRAGIIGVRLNLLQISKRFSCDDWIGLLKKVDQLDWHVEVQCEGPNLRRILSGILPHCKTIVVDHFGLPDATDPLACDGLRAIISAPAGQVFVKASAPYRIFADVPSDKAAELCIPVFRKLHDHLGPAQMVWASDWPWTQFEGAHSFEQTLQWMERWTGAVPA